MAESSRAAAVNRQMIDHNQSQALARMKLLADRWRSESDPRAVFLQCYSMMTENMLTALDEGRFYDASWVTNLLTHFAEYYFEALEAFEDPDRDTTTVWNIAHSTALAGQSFSVQNLLLGVNAHINYDLVLAVADLLRPEWSHISEAKIQYRFEDYCLVNSIIGETIDEVQDQILEPQDPILDLVDKLLGPVDELLIGHIITEWRADVWDNAVDLLNLETAEERETLRESIEQASLHKARIILLDLN
jgi:hypothetical protein